MYCTIVILCLECFHCYVIIIDCLLTSFDMLYFSTNGCINKSLTYLLTQPSRTELNTSQSILLSYRPWDIGPVRRRRVPRRLTRPVKSHRHVSIVSRCRQVRLRCPSTRQRTLWDAQRRRATWTRPPSAPRCVPPSTGTPLSIEHPAPLAVSPSPHTLSHTRTF